MIITNAVIDKIIIRLIRYNYINIYFIILFIIIFLLLHLL